MIRMGMDGHGIKVGLYLRLKCLFNFLIIKIKIKTAFIIKMEIESYQPLVILNLELLGRHLIISISCL